MSDVPHSASNPETWLNQHGDALYRYALMRVRDTAVAEDMVQETLLAALRARNSFAGQSSERTWLVAILKNKIIDHFRRGQRETPLSDHLEPDESVDEMFEGRMAGHWTEPPAAWDHPETALEQDQFWRALQDCLDGLPERQAQAFLLSEVDGLPTDELCKVLEVSTSNIWVILHRARLRLRDCLGNNWFGAVSE